MYVISAGPISTGYIGRALHSNQSLVHISLAYNAVKDDGAEVLGFALAENYRYRYIAGDCFIMRNL